ncbi:energy-coupled thiamine transporter ThiT [Bombilactobacillus thymidiniphilus]|uniref:Energy-coupled thiamine transporter ThiT n=1 Tax=Bombilactobacillus thymidiniphilus TaxID=2923363 RepID=A0ABY4PEI4_9LACO|nr:energy-coupled thiamine transporter ThiT [Bombilactobacillus thymidiniphilus]UQS84199.1 energy-coupled thiamine transporter ThiT [Bombilactobacillus thymidiniphilus]
MRSKQLQTIVEGAIIAALAMALSYVPHSLGISSIEILYGTVPIFIYAWRRGGKAAISAGIVWGLLDLFLRGFSSGSVFNAWQGILEYPVAFGLLGIAGLWSAAIKKRVQQHKNIYGLLLVSGITALLAKYLIHFFAGVLVWGSFAPKSMNPWVYSLIINGGSALATLLFVIIVVGLLQKTIARFINVY